MDERPSLPASSRLAPQNASLRAPVLILALGLGGCAVESGNTLGPYFERPRQAVPAASRAVAGPRTAVADSGLVEQNVFTLINLHRVARGMPRLTHHERLAERARHHAASMAAGRAPMSHDGMRQRLSPFLGGFFGYRAGGEILAYARDTADPARSAMASWLASYRHKGLVEDEFARMGVGVAQRGDGSYYFTVLFLR